MPYTEKDCFINHRTIAAQVTAELNIVFIFPELNIVFIFQILFLQILSDMCFTNTRTTSTTGSSAIAKPLNTQSSAQMRK
jgi:hypothetical protein